MGDYLYWLETEADIQETQAEAFPDEALRRETFAAALRETTDMLRDLGFEPAAPIRLNESPSTPPCQSSVGLSG
jgi:hypothetical protein